MLQMTPSPPSDPLPRKWHHHHGLPHQSDHILLPHPLVQLGMLLSPGPGLSLDACPQARPPHFPWKAAPAPSLVSLACPHAAWMGLKLRCPAAQPSVFLLPRAQPQHQKPGTCWGLPQLPWLSTQPLFSSLCPLPSLSSVPLAPSLRLPSPSPVHCLSPGQSPTEMPKHLRSSPSFTLAWLVLKAWSRPLVENPRPCSFPTAEVGPLLCLLPPSPHPCQVGHPGGGFV